MDTQFLTGKDAFKAYAQQQFDEIDTSIQRNKTGMFRSVAYDGRTFVGHDSNISVKSEYGRADYDYFRSGQSVPTSQIDIINMCMSAYDKVGIIRNIIDLMAEFACYGVKLQHPRKSTENFYNKWFHDIIHGPELCCKFLIMLLKGGNVIVKKSFGKIPSIDEEEWKKAINQDLSLDTLKITKRSIPIRYNFINPLSVELIGGEIAGFLGKPMIGLRLPANLKSAIQRLKIEKSSLLSKIPADIMAGINSGKGVIPLEMDKIEVFHYKKDDWLAWGNPIVSSVLSDLIMLEKMKLADISALDGAISNVRLWRVGVLDGVNSILPTKGIINKIRNILANNVGGGTLDLVWGPELDFKESNSEVWRFLGAEKYVSTLNAIYDAFGIPPSLRAGGSGSTNTASFVSLNSFIKRLQYIRDVLISFLKKELSIVHKAMGFRGPVPRIIFDNMVLADEAAEKQLILNLWDRDVISTESVREIFGRIPEVEEARVNSEFKSRNSTNMPEKASPFHNPEKEHDYKKIFVQAGELTPSEVGIEVEERKEGEKSRIEFNREMQVELKSVGPPQGTRQSGVPGRPSNITETKKRKAKPTGKPSTNAFELLWWAYEAQDKIYEYTHSSLLYAFDKQNMRKLTKEEIQIAEVVRFNMFSNLSPFENITKERVGELWNSKRNNDIYDLYLQLRKNVNSEDMSNDRNKKLYAEAYVLFYLNN